jgi:hypothetical protein
MRDPIVRPASKRRLHRRLQRLSASNLQLILGPHASASLENAWDNSFNNSWDNSFAPKDPPTRT